MVLMRKETKQAIDRINEAAKNDGTERGRELALSKASRIFGEMMDKAGQTDLAAINFSISECAEKGDKAGIDRWLEIFRKQSRNKVLMPFFPIIDKAFRTAGKAIGKSAKAEVENLRQSMR